MRRFFSSGLCAAVSACASAGGSATTTYIAPTNSTVIARLEGSITSPTGASVVVENNSTVPITVTSVSLHDCQNIKQQCTPQNTNFKIEGGSRRIVSRVEARSSEQSTSVRYSFAWHSDSAGMQALGAMAQSGSAEAAARLAAIQHADSIRKREVGFADMELSDKAVLDLGDKVFAYHAEPDSIVIKQGAMIFLQQLRVLVVAADGKSLGRYRGRYRFRVLPGTAIRFGKPDSLIAIAPGRQAIELSIVPTLTPAAPPAADPAKTVRFTLIVP